MDRDGSLYEVDPVAATVASRAPALDEVYLAGTVVYDNKLFVLGGRLDLGDLTANSDRIQIYDPETDSWGYSTIELPDARYGMLAEVVEDTLYVGNGKTVLPGDTAVIFDDFYSISMAEVATVAPIPGGFLMLGSALLGLVGFTGSRRRMSRA